ncbi:MAG TPA: hypothetical protein VJ302_30700 [Blastocatellia bacterium]|nr:hypothetical protein [Blastocatellia bacterium]
MSNSIQINLQQIVGKIARGASALVRRATFELETKLKISLTGPRTGRIYRRRGRTHQASAPGEAPAVDTGFLSNSIKSTFPSPTLGVVTISADYAQILEEDLNRPFVKPAVNDVISGLKGDVTGGLNGF